MRKKRRFFRRKVRIARPFKKTSYDGISYFKVHYRTPITANSTTSGALSVYWGSSGPSTSVLAAISD